MVDIGPVQLLKTINTDEMAIIIFLFMSWLRMGTLQV